MQKRMRLKEAREKMGYSMAELAECLGIHKATWQGYEIGRRRCPYAVLRQVVTIRKKDRAFFAELPARLDVLIDKDFPHGIPPEINYFTDEDFS
ncbi:helix-turn-helix transcriptional regulator [Oryzomonas japonica]|uniref:Helix-turn-helix transcriptional regulator n=1 Tax=Oryzomonas japonica TaxID=2603858 RepID=A0A7J4ZRA7_9BACT|nr:helix-turn-helix transcriptional regulator [Oryzomonas japonica]KAB0665643.1 helix-turn-helix transcriptional regulator [Oryzomonas japonica]